MAIENQRLIAETNKSNAFLKPSSIRPQYWFGTVLEIADIIAPVVFLGSLNIWSHNSPHSCFVIGLASFDGGPNPLTPGGSFKKT